MAMDNVIDRDDKWCRMFGRTFREEATGWYHRLPKGSIRSFTDLKASFHQAYNHQIRRKGKNLALLNTEQGTNETLWEYIKRFAIVVQKADNLSNEVAILALQSGLKANNFATKVARKPFDTLAKAIKKMY